MFVFSSPSKKFSFKRTLMFLEQIQNTFYNKNESKLRRKNLLCFRADNMKFFKVLFYFRKHILSLLVFLKKYLFLNKLLTYQLTFQLNKVSFSCYSTNLGDWSIWFISITLNKWYTTVIATSAFTVLVKKYVANFFI